MMNVASAGGPITAKIGGAAVSLLRGGLAPEQLALTICIGGAVGTVPLLWGTTLLCAILAARFGLNQAAMQSVNYLAYPLQLALFYPFLRLGARYLPGGPTLSPQAFGVALHAGPAAACATLGWGTFKAVVAWLVVPPLALLLYPLLLAFFRRRSTLRPAPSQWPSSTS